MAKDHSVCRSLSTRNKSGSGACTAARYAESRAFWISSHSAIPLTNRVGMLLLLSLHRGCRTSHERCRSRRHRAICDCHVGVCQLCAFLLWSPRSSLTSPVSPIPQLLPERCPLICLRSWSNQLGLPARTI